MPYCRNCGKKIAKDAFVCPACGVRPKTGKSRTTAVVLAVFFSYWTFLYTYRANKNIFWTCFSIQIVVYIFRLFFWLRMLADLLEGNDSFFFTVLTLLTHIPSIAIWLLVMAYTISTPTEWYLKYE